MISEDLGHWRYKGDAPLLEDAFGFVYNITNTTNDRAYIGRKYLRHGGRKTKTVKGKRVKSPTFGKDTNWRNYTGSCLTLNNDIDLIGKSNFNFEIILWSPTRGDLHYSEQFLLMINQVLHSDGFYNDSIPGLKFKPYKAVSQEDIEKYGNIKGNK